MTKLFSLTIICFEICKISFDAFRWILNGLNYKCKTSNYAYYNRFCVFYRVTLISKGSFVFYNSNPYLVIIGKVYKKINKIMTPEKVFKGLQTKIVILKLALKWQNSCIFRHTLIFVYSGSFIMREQQGKISHWKLIPCS